MGSDGALLALVESCLVEEPLRDGEPLILGHLDAHPADPRDVEIVQREKGRDEPAWKRKRRGREEGEEGEEEGAEEEGVRTSRNQNKS